MRKGVVQDTVGMKRRKQRKLQYGYEVYYSDDLGEKKALQMATWNLGRKRPKAQVDLVLNWTAGDGGRTLYIKESTFVSVAGA
eukprot:scaffold336_cov250-Pinguiococcus_pyrenoidosus.AAC.10